MERTTGHRHGRARGAPRARRAARPRPPRLASLRPDGPARRRPRPRRRRPAGAHGPVGAHRPAGRDRARRGLGHPAAALHRRSRRAGIERRRRRRGACSPSSATSATASATAERRAAWDEWVTWSHEQLEAWFGAAPLARLGDDEQEAYQRTQRVLDRLRHLDSIGPPADRAEFRATFVAELDVTPARRGTVGDGVHVGLLAGSRGLDVDLVVVLGAVEGLLPPPPSIDPLLGDEERHGRRARRIRRAGRRRPPPVPGRGHHHRTSPRHRPAGRSAGDDRVPPDAVAGRHGCPR